MLNAATKALKKLNPKPKHIAGLRDDGIERDGCVHMAFNDSVFMISGWHYMASFSIPKGMKHDVWEVGPLYPAGDHPASQYRNYHLVREHCEFPPRSEFACCASPDGTMYLTGGRSHPSRIEGFFDDMWMTKDGANWELVSEGGPWKARNKHSMVACENGDVLVLGGQGGHIEGGWESFNDVWKYVKADDKWVNLTQQAEWCKRINSTVRRGKDGELVICGGEVVCPEMPPNGLFSETEEEVLHDVWKSTDNGKSWKCTCSQPPFPAARGQWLEYLPINKQYIIFGKRCGNVGMESRVYTSEDLVQWDELHEEIIDNKYDAVANNKELICTMTKEDGTLVFICDLLT